MYRDALWPRSEHLHHGHDGRVGAAPAGAGGRKRARAAWELARALRQEYRFTLPEASRAVLEQAAQATPALGFVKPTPVLHFGAVDGDADIFLDGEKIGEQKEPAEVMWDQAFTVALPVPFAASTPHTLVVRVKKGSQAAGIWRPVKVAMRGE